MRTLRALAALLSYPTADLVEAAPEIRGAIDREALVPASERDALHRLIDDLATGDLYDLQERYGLLFDRTRALSLHLFEHVHGESRDRGQAMVDLLKLYEEGGYTPAPSELPDFLPLFLEYASTREPAEAVALVRDLVNTPAADMGPQDLEDARHQQHGAARQRPVPGLFADLRARPGAFRLGDRWRAGGAGRCARQTC